jgi:hypothetical protein
MLAWRFFTGLLMVLTWKTMSVALGELLLLGAALDVPVASVVVGAAAWLALELC